MDENLIGHLQVLAIPAFADNYVWLIHDGIHAAVVDPGDAMPVLAVLAAKHLSLVAILLTHHHADHVGGVAELLQAYPLPVFGPRLEAIDQLTQQLGQDDKIVIPELSLHLSILDVPGHTIGHIAYLTQNTPTPWLFCGDTLFAGGCGRVFEGTPAQMAASLEKLAALPDETEVFCAHEYTLANLKFAQRVEPGNAALVARVQLEQDKRASQLATVPSTIALEKQTNPFLRYREAEIVSSLITADQIDPVLQTQPVALFSALRNWKNNFR